VTLDVARVRKDFPILEREVHGKRLVYLDSANTSQKPRQVIDAVSDYYERYNAGVHRAIHVLGEEATAAYEQAREKVASFVNAPGPQAVVFTRGTTESTNLVAYAWVRRRLGPGDEILATVMEHHSNIVPWQLAAKDSGATLSYIPVTDGGELDLSTLDDLVTSRTKLVCVTGMSNVLGTIPDLGPLVEAAHAVGALVLVDGAQLVPHVPTDFAALGCDFLAFSSHKMIGPMGVGALVARPELLEEMDPFLGGGEMIRDVALEGSTWNDVPWKFEAGTMMTAEAVGFGAAIDYLDDLGMDAVREHELELVRYGLKTLQAVKGLHVYGPAEPDRRGSTFSFNVFSNGDLIHPHDVGQILDQEGVAIRAGHHCAKPLMRRFDVPAMCRASLYVYNTPGEIDALAESVDKARVFFSGE
jgi:cysteine desulfurase / selenocysteine lyase